MKFREIFRYELRYQLRTPWPWLTIAILMSLGFLFIRDGAFAEALYSEFYLNSPFSIAMTTVFGCLLWLLMGAFVAGEAASRDVASGMHPLVYTLSLNKAQYLGGRFFAAFTINAFVLLMVQMSMMLGAHIGVHHDLIGPFRPEAFLTAYFYIAIPNAFAATAIQFALALRSGRPIMAYIGSLLLFVTGFFIATLIRFKTSFISGMLIDPIGIHFIWDDLSHLWTTVEKNTRLLKPEGTLLQNRLVWIGTGTVVSAITFFTFKFKHRTTGSALMTRIFRQKKIKDQPYVVYQPQPLAIRKPFSRSFGSVFHIRQLLAIAWTSFKTIALSWSGLALLICLPLMAILIVIDQMVAMSVPMVPATNLVIKELTMSLSADVNRWMVVPGFIIFFAGELAWRERDNNLSEITDAMPGSAWMSVLGKLLGLSLLLIAFTITLSGAGIIAQVLMGYNDFEIGLYLKIMFGLQLPEYLLFAVLAIFVHAFVNQKYLGHLVAIVSYAYMAAIANMLGIEHNLWIYGAGPAWSYTEMRDFGSTIGPWLWFKLYWAAWALLLITLAMLFWVRGKENNVRFRIQLFRQRVTRSAMYATVLAVILILSIGGFILYNTNTLNKYLDSTEVAKWRADYERLYGKYENVPMPLLTGTKLRVEIYPEKGTAEIKGSYRLINNSVVLIDSIHITTTTGNAVTKSITFDRAATLTLNDEEHAYRIYKLTNALAPGDSLTLHFEEHFEQHGFSNSGIDRAIAPGGTYLSNAGRLPSLGFQRQRALTGAAERREHRLEPRALMASLYEAHEGAPPSIDRGIQFEAIVGTTPDQVAVAPGELKRTWREDDRAYFQYETSKPIGSDWAFFSGKYEIYEKKFSPDSSDQEPVTIRIFHFPEHTAHLEPMMHGALECMKYYTKTFGPYPYSHLTLAEHPYAPGTGLHAEPSLIYYGQGYPYWTVKDNNQLDFPYAVMGHEMGHQWTLPLALTEGLPFMSEGLAWYYGIMMVKTTRGEDQTRRLMSFLRTPYPHQPIRRGEPLLRALDPYLSYRKGPFALYALTEYVGTKEVNSAIRQLVKGDSVGAPLITTLDLYRELQKATPTPMKYLLHDLFEVNTLWQLTTRSVKAVETKKGTWEVTMNLHAKKIVYDSAGLETEVPMNELIPVGIFGERKPGHDELSTQLHLEKHQIHSGDQVIVITVSGKPVLAGIDPHHLLDWEEKEDDDNIAVVTKMSRDD